MQSMLLFQHSLIFSGRRHAFIHLQFYRNVLITFSRRLLSQDGSVLRVQTISERPSNVWLEWVRTEAERRIIYFTWSEECLTSPTNIY